MSEIEFVDSLPSDGRRAAGRWRLDILAQLRAHPGQWAIVRRAKQVDYKNAPGWGAWLKKDTTDIEAFTRRTDDEYRCYARAVVR